MMLKGGRLSDRKGPKGQSRGLLKSESEFMLPREEDYDRKRRLLMVALQIPQVDNLLRAVAVSRRFHAIQRRFDIWKEFTRQERIIFQAWLSKRISAAIILQSVVRMFIGSRRVIKRRLRLYREAELRRKQAATSIQCLFRVMHAKLRVAKLRRLQPEIVANRSAALIQRVFRGMLGRALVLHMERRKLMKFLRKWSRGRSSNLFHISVIQEPEAQALIYTAISFVTMPSRPIRDLPTLQTFRKYRAGLLALYWQLQFRFAARKEEAAKRREERKMMYYEELYSTAYETIVKAHVLKQKQLQQQEEENKLQQEREAEKRREFLAAQTLINLHNKQMLKERADKETQWRVSEAITKEKEWIAMVLQREADREWEMMKAEDGFSQAREKFDQTTLSAESTLKVEAAKVHAARMTVWQTLKYIESRRMKATLTETVLLAHIDRYEAYLSTALSAFFRSLHLSDEAQEEIHRLLVTERTAELRTAYLQQMMLNLLHTSNYSYRLVQMEIVRMQSWLKHSDRIYPRHLLMTYLARRTEEDSALRKLLQNSMLLSGLKSHQMQGSLLKLGASTDVPAAGLKKEYLHDVQFSFRLHLPSSNIGQYAMLIQYRHLKSLNRKVFRSLTLALGDFKQKHAALKALRKEIQESKVLRSVRKDKLAVASGLEQTLFSLRSKIIEEGMLLYDSIYYEIRVFFDLFYPSESNVYYRSVNSALSSPSGIRARQGSADGITPLSSATSSPHMRRNNPALRRSLDSSLPPTSSGRERADSTGSSPAPLFQSPDQRSTTSLRKRSLTNSVPVNLTPEVLTAAVEETNSVSTGSPPPSATKDASDQTKGSHPKASGAEESKAAASSSTHSSNRKKGKVGMARANHRRKSMGSANDNPFSSGNNKTPSSGGSPAANSAIKVKLTARKFNYLIDDHEEYWQDLLSVSMDGYALPPALFLSLLPIPPKPTTQHDGYRHVIKVKPILIRQSHYGPNGPIPHDHSPVASPSKTRKKKGVSLVVEDEDGNFIPSTERVHKGHIRWAKKKEVFTPINPQTKERKFFDIPGENAFLESEPDRYDFYLWVSRLILWARDVLHRNHDLAQGWKAQTQRQLLAMLHAQRMKYLLSLDEDSHLPRSSDSPEMQAETCALQHLVESAAVDIADMYDMFLCSYDLSLTATIPGNAVDARKGTSSHSSSAVEYSLKISGGELDYVLSRQPFSLLARRMMVQEVSVWHSRYFALFPPQLQPPNNMQLRQFLEHPLLTYFMQLPSVAPLHKLGLEIYPVLSKEYEELQDLARVLVENNCLVYDSIQQKLLLNTPGYQVTPDGPQGLVNALEKPQSLRKIGVQILQTEHIFLPVFPRYMQPVFRFGEPAPPESFHKQLLREKARGVVGKYGRINEKDQRVDDYARRLLRALTKRRLLRDFLVDLWEEQRLVDLNRDLMSLEDSHALLVRKHEKEVAHELRSRQLFQRMFRACIGCLTCGSAMCHSCTQPKVFPDDEEDRYAAAVRSLRHPSVQQLQKDYVYYSAYPEKTIEIITAEKVSSRVIDELMRMICNNGYRITSGDRVEAIAQLIRTHEMWRVVARNSWEALEEDFIDVDTIQVTEHTHYRQSSWFTGQVVSVNTQTGGYLDMQQLVHKHIGAMSAVYERLSQLPALAVGQRQSIQIAEKSSGSEKTQQLIDIGLETRHSDNQLQPPQTGVVTSSNGASSLPLSKMMPEFWIGGGLHRAVIAMRIIEHVQVNERGVIIVEDLDLPDAVCNNLQSVQRSFGSVTVPHRVYQSIGDAASKYGLEKRFDEQSLGWILRGGFAYQPFCVCCQHSLRPQYGNCLHNEQQVFYCDQHLSRLQNRFAITITAKHRQELLNKAAQEKKVLLPQPQQQQPPMVGKNKSSAGGKNNDPYSALPPVLSSKTIQRMSPLHAASLATLGEMRSDFMRYLVHYRYSRQPGLTREVWLGIVYFQAIVRGKLRRLAMERARERERALLALSSDNISSRRDGSRLSHRLSRLSSKLQRRNSSHGNSGRNSSIQSHSNSHSNSHANSHSNSHASSRAGSASGPRPATILHLNTNINTNGVDREVAPLDDTPLL